MRAAFDQQVRQHPDAGADSQVERAPGIVRTIGVPGGWSGVVWSELDAASADGVIASEVSRFSIFGRPWEWKYYSYDTPADLPRRLLGAGFEPEPVESLLVAEIADLDLSASPPMDVELREVSSADGLSALVDVHNEVFGGDHSDLGRALAPSLESEPRSVVAVLAMSQASAVAAGRVEFHPGTDFASLWGGGTLAKWRGRGIFRALVAYRAKLAADRGFRYLQVDASAESRPILQRLGFVELATTTPFMHPGTN